jgi:hypothetical protein
MFRRAGLTAALLACLAMAACGPETPAKPGSPADDAPAAAAGDPAGDPPAGAADTGDPCDLLTPEQAAEALRAAEVMPAERVGDHCSYPDAARPTRTIGVGRNSMLPDEAALKALMVQAQDKFPGTEVDGLGDVAYYVEAAGTMYFVVDDKVYFAVSLGDDPRAVTTSAAKSVIANVT